MVRYHFLTDDERLLLEEYDKALCTQDLDPKKKKVLEKQRDLFIESLEEKYEGVG